MAQFHPVWVAHQRKRWLRPNARLWLRPDLHRFMPPGSPRYVGQDVVRYLCPDSSNSHAVDAGGHQASYGGARNHAFNHCGLTAKVAADERLLRDLQYDRARSRYELACRRLRHSLKYGYNPSQPRVPAGSPDGGQWASGESQSERVRIAGIGRTIVQLLKAALKLRLSPSDNAARRARDMLNRVRHLDPLWQPSSNSDEGIAQEAGKRLAEFAALPADRLIAIYRAQNSMPDLFGQPTWRLDKGTVAVTKLDGVPEFGVNSKAPGYEGKDTATADTMRRLLIETYPEEMKRSNNVGRMPNDSVYHAEATVLFRAARRYEGTLKGRTIDVYVDRDMCRSCDKVLPLIGQELGNPTVTYVDLRSGETATMRDGKWINRTRP